MVRIFKEEKKKAKMIKTIKNSDFFSESARLDEGGRGSKLFNFIFFFFFLFHFLIKFQTYF